MTAPQMIGWKREWQNGPAYVLWQNRDMMFDLRYGRMDFVALPYQWLFEHATPAIEVVGWATKIPTIGYHRRRRRKCRGPFCSLIPDLAGFPSAPERGGPLEEAGVPVRENGQGMWGLQRRSHHPAFRRRLFDDAAARYARNCFARLFKRLRSSTLSMKKPVQPE